MLAEKPKNSCSPVDTHVSRYLPIKYLSFRFKAENLGAGCEHIFVNVFSQQTQVN